MSLHFFPLSSRYRAISSKTARRYRCQLTSPPPCVIHSSEATAVPICAGQLQHRLAHNSNIDGGQHPQCFAPWTAALPKFANEFLWGRNKSMLRGIRRCGNRVVDRACMFNTTSRWRGEWNLQAPVFPTSKPSSDAVCLSKIVGVRHSLGESCKSNRNEQTGGGGKRVRDLGFKKGAKDEI